MGKVTSEETRSGRSARRGSHMALGEGDPLVYQSICMRSVEVRVSERSNCVVTLLVGDDENYVGAFHGVDDA